MMEQEEILDLDGTRGNFRFKVQKNPHPEMEKRKSPCQCMSTALSWKRAKPCTLQDTVSNICNDVCHVLKETKF